MLFLQMTDMASLTGQLVERMTACQPHFIRCIKPNQMKQSNNFVVSLSLLSLSSCFL